LLGKKRPNKSSAIDIICLKKTGEKEIGSPERTFFHVDNSTRSIKKRILEGRKTQLKKKLKILTVAGLRERW
jgi:hypothetical protein